MVTRKTIKDLQNRIDAVFKKLNFYCYVVQSSDERLQIAAKHSVNDNVVFIRTFREVPTDE